MHSAVLLRLTVGTSVAVALYQATIFHLGYETSEEFERVWGYAFPLLLAFWVDEDSRGRREVYRPSFDIGLFIYLIWILYLPFYLLRTRGKNGWLWIVGLILLVFLGTILRLAIYVVS